MNIPPKCEDLHLKIAELERREAALREELEAESKGADRAAESLMKWRRDCMALQQRLTVAEQREDELRRVLAGMLFAFDDGVGRGWSAPLLDYARRFTPAVEFELSIGNQLAALQLAALKPAEEVESPGARPVGCCCPPKGHIGIWAAAMCPVHFGLKRPGVKPAEECPHNYSNPTGCPVCQGVKP